MKKYRRVYIEITTKCNLKCSFCPDSLINRKDMDYDFFDNITGQLLGTTPVIYYHVLGEPLIHKDIGRFLKCSSDKGFKSAITTNGLLLKEKKDIFKDIKLSRLNISLQAYGDINNKLSFEKMKEVIDTAEEISKENGTIVFFRLWDIEQEKDKEILNYLKDKYDKEIDFDSANKPDGFIVADRIRVSLDSRFIWPLNAEKGNERGFCQGLRTHFAILSDGTVVPCCLDAKGEIALGNLHNQSLSEILNNEKTNSIYEGFTAKKAVTSLCKKCEYKNRFNSSL